MHHFPIKYHVKIEAYFSYKNFSSKFKLKSCSIVLKSEGVIVWHFPPSYITFTSISDAFSIVCITPNAISSVSPLHRSPWCAQITASYFSISLPVAMPISSQHGTFHSITPTPFGNTMEHSVIISHSPRVNTSDLSGNTYVKIFVYFGCEWYTTLYFPPVAFDFILCVKRCAEISLVGLPPFTNPHTTL